MQKKLIALAVASLAAVPAFAQSNVTLYGRVNMSYIHSTNDNKAGALDPESRNRWGIMGEEDLGGGLSAVFRLENSFYLDTGRTQNEAGANVTTSNTATQFKEHAWVGLNSKSLGQFSFGRLSSAGYTTLGGDGGFAGDTIGTFGTRRGKITPTWDNAARYESPKFGPMTIVATYGLPETSSTGTVSGRARYGVTTRGVFGPFTAELSYQKDTAKDEEDGLGTTAAGVAIPYAYGNAWKTYQADFVLNVAKGIDLYSTNSWSKAYENLQLVNGTDLGTTAKVTRALVGARFMVGAKGQINSNIGRGWERGTANDQLATESHVGLGYWHNISKRTILMANFAWDRKFDAYSKGADGTAKDVKLSSQFGVRHTF